MDLIFSRIQTLLKSCDTGLPCFPPTALFNEGWMLRSVLDWFASHAKAHPLAVPPGCRWYSEALLPSAFLAEYRGDARSETWTHADGVVGDFDLGQGAKGDLSLRKDAQHLVVIEAKMFSKLSAGTKNAPNFNQGARNVACMAELLKRAGIPPARLTSLGFYVVAPASQIELKLFDEHLSKSSIEALVKQRIEAYGGKREQWFSDWFRPTLARLEVKAVSWEELIGFIEKVEPEAGLREFYARCLKLNDGKSAGTKSGKLSTS